MIEDDPNDVLLIRRALIKCEIRHPVHVVENGEKAMAYLTGAGGYSDRASFPLPGLILTDLKMPRMNGIELLRWLKGHADYKVIPTIVLTSSMESSDIRQAYLLGANSYLVKPANFEDLRILVRTVFDYWCLCKVALAEALASAAIAPPVPIHV